MTQNQSAREAMKTLTRAQRMYVRDGSIHGDCTMRTVRGLQAKGMFYLKISSPNGQCGFMELTDLGREVQTSLIASGVRHSLDHLQQQGEKPSALSSPLPGEPG